MEEKSYSFDHHGDLNSGYDIILWKQTQDSLDVNNILAYYSIEHQNLTFTSQETQQALQRHIVSVYLSQVILLFNSFITLLFYHWYWVPL